MYSRLGIYELARHNHPASWQEGSMAPGTEARERQPQTAYGTGYLFLGALAWIIGCVAIAVFVGMA